MHRAEDDATDLKQALGEAWQPIRQLGSISMLLSWDQETYLPAAAQVSRAQQLSTLAGLTHDQLGDSRVADLVSEVLERCSPEERLYGHAFRAKRHIVRTTRIPKELAQRLAAAAPAATAAWQQARAEDSMTPYAPHLEILLDLKRQEAAALGGRNAYDSLVDEFEPGMTVGQLDPLFASLESEVQTLMSQVSESPAVDESAAQGRFPAAGQLELGTWIARKIGFSFDHGRLDLSAHPFCTGMHPHDVRITWRADETDFRPGLFGIMHEAGHGLYEQGLDPTEIDLPATEAASLGVHESQSRIWENQVGRSRGFWRGIEPSFRETFGTDTSTEALWPALNAIRPSLIRVDADEISYLLHIAIRYRIERALLDDQLRVSDLEAAWNDAYSDLLGVVPKNLTEGVLQDIHWAAGLFGYFPTYALGTMLAAQLYDAAQSQLGDLEDAFSHLEFEPLLEWLRHHVHRPAATKTPAEITRDSTGSALSAKPLLDAARRRVDELYA